jgi:hypothetical protein
MKIILFFVLTSLITANIFVTEKYLKEMDKFCSGINEKVCTNDMIVYGMIYFGKQLSAMKTKINDKKKLSRKAEQIRRMKHFKEQRLLQILREPFLDSHL